MGVFDDVHWEAWDMTDALQDVRPEKGEIERMQALLKGGDE